MHKKVYCRVIAYLIDLFLVGMISTAFSSVNFINPRIDDYNKSYEEYREYVLSSDYDNNTFFLNDEKAIDLSYKLAYNEVPKTIITIIITFLYFGIFQFYTGGKTIGKLLFKLEVVSNDKKKLSLKQIILRSLIINGILTSSLMVIMLYVLSKSAFNKIGSIIQLLDIAILIISFIMIINRKDGIGLHDLIANTRVISSLEKDLFFNEETNNKRKKVKDVKFYENRNSK